MMERHEIESLALFIAKKMAEEGIVSDAAPVEKTIVPSVKEWLEEFFA